MIEHADARARATASTIFLFSMNLHLRHLNDADCCSAEAFATRPMKTPRYSHQGFSHPNACRCGPITPRWTISFHSATPLSMLEVCHLQFGSIVELTQILFDLMLVPVHAFPSGAAVADTHPRVQFSQSTCSE